MGFFSGLVDTVVGGAKSLLGSVTGSGLLSAGTTLLGGLMGNKKQEDSNELAIQLANQEYERQKEFAQMGIRWKAEDAKAAGLHPLAAIGSLGASYSPTIAAQQPVDGLSRSISDMGQDLTRAKVATMSEQDKQLGVLALKNATLRNDALEAEIAQRWASIDQMLRQPSMPSSVGSGPGTVAVSAPVGAVKVEPRKAVSSAPGASHVEAGTSPSMTTFTDASGKKFRVPNQQLAEILENMGTGVPQAFMLNNWLQEKMYGPGVPQTKIPNTHEWRWNKWRQQYDLERR